ncbi:MAG TPA: His/Gly/Thr/Pro-type tRNA ligase C-terminal domain-containing protein [Candidatus Paceibacterota bacterium]|nr:His/Gly/Thr/Pro-type tRNA ligase C-terminal domain-containing protein [Candidatus Paceibacterota bacterium]
MSAPQRLSPASFIKHAADVSSFYGFRPVKEVERLVPSVDRIRGNHSFAAAAHMTSALLAQKPKDPILSYYASPVPSHMPGAYSPKDTGEFGLQVSGSPDSLGEVLILKTLFAILNEWGAGVSRVRINTLGDRDSKNRFERELSGFMRKRGNEVGDCCRENLAHNPFALYNCQGEACRTVIQEGPRAMNFLSEKSRVHFKDVLEHVEKLGLPYELDDLLVGDERDPRLVFALDLENDDATILGTHGGRYDDYLRKLSNRKEGSMVSASIFFRKKGAVRSHFTPHATSKNPKVYFVQLGTRAKLEGLTVVDMLRSAGVPVAQSFDAKSLTPQLESAKQQGVSHLIIMGQREALDHTVIVRAANNSSQTIVELAALPRFLKTIKV